MGPIYTALAKDMIQELNEATLIAFCLQPHCSADHSPKLEPDRPLRGARGRSREQYQVLLGGSGDLVSRLSNMASDVGLWGILTRLTKSTDHPSAWPLLRTKRRTLVKRTVLLLHVGRPSKSRSPRKTRSRRIEGSKHQEDYPGHSQRLLMLPQRQGGYELRSRSSR